MVPFFFGCVGVLFALFVGLLIGSTIVRAAVSFANRIVGPAPAPPDTFGQWDDWDSDEPAPKPRKKKERVIPEPGLVTGVFISFAGGVFNVLVYVLMVFIVETVLDADDNGPDGLVPIILLVLGLPITWMGLSVLFTVLLPTTLVRGALVAFLHHLIAVVVVLVAGGAVFAAWYAVAP